MCYRGKIENCHRRRHRQRHRRHQIIIRIHAVAQAAYSRPLIMEADSSNAVPCGINGRDSRTKTGLSPSPPFLPAVRTTPPHLNVPSFVYHRHLAAASVIEKLKIIKI